MNGKNIKGYIWLILCITFLLITHVLFKMSAPFEWLEHVWEAGDFISFVGTIVLGYVAYQQSQMATEQMNKSIELTERANKINERMLTIEARFLQSDIILGKIIQGQNASIIPLSNDGDQYDTNTRELCFSIANSGGAILQIMKIEFDKNQHFQSYVALSTGAFKNVKINIPKEFPENKELDVIFTSCYDKKTYGSFRVAYKREQPHLIHYHYKGITQRQADAAHK